MGLIFIDLADRNSEYLEDAKECFRESSGKNAAHQRCYYNLGTIYIGEAVILLQKGEIGKGRDQLHSALNEFRTALKYKNWEKEPSAELTSAVHYNLACCLCRLASGMAPAQGRSIEFDEVISHLEIAASYEQTKPATLINDLHSPTGDLQGLHENRFYTDKVESIGAQFQKHWA